jgi:sugar phosphate isomerase/epimerase
MPFRYAICNETFEGWSHADVCRAVAQLGYQGVEIAPFTLAPRIGDVSAEQRANLGRQAEDCGLQIIGLHWLLAKTEGFHLNSADPTVRGRTAVYLGELARCCRDLGGDLMVFGSPAQRRVPAGASREQAMDWAADTFRQAAPIFADCGVRLCLEPLSPAETDFLNTIDDALDLQRRIDHPSITLHLDVKAMSTETSPIPALVRQHGGHAGHFHANDANRRGPGFGPTDFVPIFQALAASGYQGWVSVEVFDYSPDPLTIAKDSIRYMRKCEGSKEFQPAGH